jgi:hypothetical protein
MPGMPRMPPRERQLSVPLGPQVDARVARMAAGQWSIVDAADLRACGMTPKGVRVRVRNGRLFVVFRGVYSLTPHLTLEGLFLAAVKACGPGAALSHYSAGVLWGWYEWDGRFPEVTTVNARKIPGIFTHRAQAAPSTVHRGIPVTTVERTLMDLSGKFPYRRVRRAVSQALSLGQIRPAALVTSRHRGAKLLRLVLANSAPTRNEYEDIVFALIGQAGLPRPVANVRQGRYIPDFLWTEHGVILEADSRQWHDNLIARADDRRRQRDLEARGFLVIRTTWREVTTRPDRVIARIRTALASRTPT